MVDCSLAKKSYLDHCAGLAHVKLDGAHVLVEYKTPNEVDIVIPSIESHKVGDERTIVTY